MWVAKEYLVVLREFPWTLWGHVPLVQWSTVVQHFKHSSSDQRRFRRSTRGCTSGLLRAGRMSVRNGFILHSMTERDAQKTWLQLSGSALLISAIQAWLLLSWTALTISTNVKEINDVLYPELCITATCDCSARRMRRMVLVVEMGARYAGCRET